MPSNDHGVQISNWYHGIPDFQPTALFTYFETLNSNTTVGLNGQEVRNSPLAYARKQALYKQSKAYASSIGTSLSENSTAINSALDFLLKVAQSESEKERHILQSYKQLLQNALPDNKELNELLKKFNSTYLTKSNFDELTKTYQEITKYINIIRKGLETYKVELERFKKHQTMEMNELYDDDPRMRLQSEIHSIENSVVGEATSAQKDDDSYYASLLRNMIGKYMVSKKILNKVESGEDLVAIVVAIAIEMEQYMQQAMLKKKNDMHLKNFNTNELKSMLLEFIEDEDRPLTRLEEALESDSKDLREILDTVKSVTGIKLNSDKKLLASRQNKYNNQKDRKDSIINALVEDNLSQEMLDELFTVTFTGTGSNTMHGNIFELFTMLLNKNTIKVFGNAGTDLITVGSINLEYNSNFNEKLFKKQIKRISNSFTEFADTERKNRHDTLTKKFNTMNNAVYDATKEITDALRDLDARGIKVDDFFIYHESLKLYKSAEASDQKFTKFHGRDLQILTYIDEMYSLNKIKDLQLVQKEALQFLALNIADGAIGSSQKENIANYFGIFAGMLMFDDAYNMAEDMIQKVSKNTSPTAYNIHLYNLNGFYVPASMLLYYTYNSMKNIFSKLTQSQFGIKVNISTSAATKVINLWLDNEWRHGELKTIGTGKNKKLNPAFENYSNYYSAGEWGRVGEAVSQVTKVRVAMFASFTQFIQDMLP